LVTSFSTKGLISLALGSVVSILPCSTKDLASEWSKPLLTFLTRLSFLSLFVIDASIIWVVIPWSPKISLNFGYCLFGSSPLGSPKCPSFFFPWPVRRLSLHVGAWESGWGSWLTDSNFQFWFSKIQDPFFEFRLFRKFHLPSASFSASSSSFSSKPVMALSCSIIMAWIFQELLLGVKLPSVSINILKRLKISAVADAHVLRFIMTSSDGSEVRIHTIVPISILFLPTTSRLTNPSPFSTVISMFELGVFFGQIGDDEFGVYDFNLSRNLDIFGVMVLIPLAWVSWSGFVDEHFNAKPLHVEHDKHHVFLDSLIEENSWETPLIWPKSRLLLGERRVLSCANCYQWCCHIRG